jgi:ribosome-binding factor A
VWSTSTFNVVFLDDLHMKHGWMLQKASTDKRKAEVYATVMAMRAENKTEASKEASKRWSRRIGRAIIVDSAEPLEIVEIAATRV